MTPTKKLSPCRTGAVSTASVLCLRCPADLSVSRAIVARVGGGGSMTAHENDASFVAQARAQMIPPISSCMWC